MTLPIHVEIWITANILAKKKNNFKKQELMQKIREMFNDTRPGISTHISSYCVASSKADPGAYRYLTRVKQGTYRPYEKGDETHPSKKHAPLHPKIVDLPQKYRYLLSG